MSKAQGIGSRAVAGTVYLGAAQAAKVIITILSAIVTARLLDPAQYGVAAMVSPITGFILIFQNMGLNQAVVQSKTLSPQQTNALFWLNLIASAVIAVIFVALSPVVAHFYGDQRPGYVMAASSATVLLTALSLQHVALLNRNMKFRQLGVIDVVGTLTTFIATAVAAYVLRSYWAIWIGTFASAIVTVVLVWTFSSWRPTMKTSFEGTRSLLGFGANVTGFNILNYLVRNLDNVLIAKVWGPSAVGLYDRSYKLMMFPITNINQPLSRIMLPILSRLQDEPERYRAAYVMAIRTLSLVSAPGILAAAICSERLVPFLLGERWAAAAPIFFWLSLVAVAQPISNSTGWLFMSSGRSGAMVRWGLFSAPTTIASFAIGLPWGPSGVAAAYFVGQMIRTPFLYAWSTRGTPVRMADLYFASIPTLFGGAATYLIVRLLPPSLNTPGLLAITLALSYALSAAFQCTTPGGRRTLAKLFSMAKQILEKVRSRRKA